MSEKILVVDDDREINRLVRSYLTQAGYQVQSAYSGEEALTNMRYEKPDLVLLDLMLPGQNGWDVTKIVRSNQLLLDIPIIMLTAKVEDMDKIMGLDLGADDYITKPFNPQEVTARVRAMLRRQNRIVDCKTSPTLTVGQIRIDVDSHVATLAGNSLELTPTEFSLLRVLVQNTNFVLTRSELIEQALGYNHESIERTLDSHIKNLRRKIGDSPKNPRYIQTIYGVGYKLIG